jgi:hypothetical protein
MVGRLALAAVFLWAAYTKLRDPWMVFAMEIDAMHIVPGTAVELVARAMPWFELVVGVLLVIGIQMRRGAGPEGPHSCQAGRHVGRRLEDSDDRHLPDLPLGDRLR